MALDFLYLGAQIATNLHNLHETISHLFGASESDIWISTR